MSKNYKGTEPIINMRECKYLVNETWCMNPRSIKFLGWIKEIKGCRNYNCLDYVPEDGGAESEKAT